MYARIVNILVLLRITIESYIWSKELAIVIKVMLNIFASAAGLSIFIASSFSKVVHLNLSSA
jgi:hypothetical protein